MVSGALFCGLSARLDDPHAWHDQLKHFLRSSDGIVGHGVFKKKYETR